VIEVDDGHGRAHRGDLGHDVVKLGVEARGLVDKVDPGGSGDVLQLESITLARGGSAGLGGDEARLGQGGGS